MTLRTLNYGNHGRFLIMGNAGFISSTVLMLLSLSGLVANTTYDRNTDIRTVAIIADKLNWRD